MDFYRKKVQESIKDLTVDPTVGLSSDEVKNRLKINGFNKFDEARNENYFVKFLRHMADFTTIILIIAAIISFYTAIITDHGNYIEGIIIVFIVILNAVLAMVQESNAEKSLDALKSLNRQMTKVIRNGKIEEVLSENLVIGDLLVLEAGIVIPADARLIESVQLRITESALTGESEALEKNADFVAEKELPLGDRVNMIFSGCTVVGGRGTAVITATGMQTEMGKIAGLLNGEKKEKTPLQERLNQLGQKISILALIAAAIVFGIGFSQGEPLLEMFMTAVSLAVAAVPETLMVIVTLTLSVGVQKMVKKHAIIRHLPAVETLGNASVICTDKTGTLTQNQMKVRRVWYRGDVVIDVEEGMTDEAMEILKMASLCSDAIIERTENGPKVIGNPTEGAILLAVEENYHTRMELEDKYPRVGEIPFDSTRKLMTTVHKMGKKYISITKGAFDVMSPKVRFGDLEQATVVNDRFGKRALRVIAVGFRIYDEEPQEITSEFLERNMQLLGLIGIIDPPRPESKGAIAKAKQAGIRTVMITGDHVVTASAIAKELGILEDVREAMTGEELQKKSDRELVKQVKNYSVYARVTPEDKIRIVKAWQETGAVVAMTGDGVNDAPALKASDVGCAMGITGTDVAKSASDIILTDDNFATIVDVVAEGRTVYKNIRKAVNFLLSCNISEIFIVVVAMLAGWGAPVNALQLLFINVVADGLPGFALSREQAEKNIMSEKPIPKNQSIFAGGLWKWILFNSFVFTAITLLGFYLGSFVDSISPWMNASHEIGQTMAFLILGYSSILHVFNCRSSLSIFKIKPSSNKKLVEMAIFALLLITAVAIIPVLQSTFALVQISLNHWRLVAFLSVVPVLITELVKFHFSKED